MTAYAPGPQAVFAPVPVSLAAMGHYSLRTEYEQALVPLFIKVRQGVDIPPHYHRAGKPCLVRILSNFTDIFSAGSQASRANAAHACEMWF